jgi:hypothetical protein
MLARLTPLTQWLLSLLNSSRIYPFATSSGSLAQVRLQLGARPTQYWVHWVSRPMSLIVARVRWPSRSRSIRSACGHHGPPPMLRPCPYCGIPVLYRHSLPLWKFPTQAHLLHIQPILLAVLLVIALLPFGNHLQRALCSRSLLPLGL